MTRADLLAGALDEFIGVSPEVEAAAVVSADGLPMASALPEHVEEDRLAAMSAALLILGERAASGLGKRDLSQVMVESADGYVVLMSAGPHAVIVAVSSTSAKPGLLLFEMRRMAEKVASLMRQDLSATISGAPDREQAAGPSSDSEAPAAAAVSDEESSVSAWQ
jgi:predicted regulator of Ras-like GTPase activity (Roadblock/LC7/MglB family)